jgi:hypothetical protein
MKRKVYQKSRGTVSLRWTSKTQEEPPWHKSDPQFSWGEPPSKKVHQFLVVSLCILGSLKHTYIDPLSLVFPHPCVGSSPFQQSIHPAGWGGGGKGVGYWALQSLALSKWEVGATVHYYGRGRSRMRLLPVSYWSPGSLQTVMLHVFIQPPGEGGGEGTTPIGILVRSKLVY